MKLPESMQTVRSAGSRSSSAIDSVRGSIRSAVDASSNGTSRQRSRAGEPPADVVGAVARSRGQLSARADAVAATSPATPRSIAPVRAEGVGLDIDLHDGRVRRRSARPWRIVHMFSAQPQPTIRSAPRISSAASGEAKPPDTSSDHGSSWNSPFAAALVASSAPCALGEHASAPHAPPARAARGRRRKPAASRR